MESVQTITLGKPPTEPDDPDERVVNMMKILELGFPEGAVIALCSKCQTFEEYGLDEAAIMIVDHTWPYCCSIKMLMEDPMRTPLF